MTNTAIAADSPLVEDQAVQLRRAIIASTIGTMIEWYDFYIYGIVTGLVFGKLFFPESEPLTGTLQAFGVYAVGFISRPIGAAIFGHYGDRIGRKSTLIATLMLMGIATFLVALVPTYDSIGVWGAVILTFLRFMQGVGGEWGGSVLLSMEWCKSDRRILYRARSVQRCIARLSICARHCRRSRAADCDLSLCEVSVGLCDCRVYPGLRRAHDHCHRFNDRLHWQGH
jgi:hypothetical protein